MFVVYITKKHSDILKNFLFILTKQFEEINHLNFWNLLQNLIFLCESLVRQSLRHQSEKQDGSQKWWETYLYMTLGCRRPATVSY